MAGALLWLVWWHLVLYIPGLIPKEEAQRVAHAEAQQMCEERSKQEDIECGTLKIVFSDTSRPGITDSESSYYYFKLTADNKNLTKQWDFDITLLPDGEVEMRESRLSIDVTK